MKWLRLTTALLASSLEGLAVVVALRGHWGLVLGLHAASCACAAAFAHRRLLEGPAGWSFALVFAGTLILPGFGALGLAALALTSPRAAGSAHPELVRTPVPGPPELAAESGPGSAPGRRRGREARLEAVAEERGRKDPTTIARLRRALEDPDEDVRLLAHAVLEATSRMAYRRIHEAERELEIAPGSRRAAVEFRLAKEHLELAWLGLVEGVCLDQVLGTARRHALAALREDPGSGSLHFLLGRIALCRGELREAQSALRRAGDLGMPSAQLAPRLAEVAFLSRRFDLVRRSLDGADGASETVHRLRTYWA